jgi:hypothetical protein
MHVAEMNLMQMFLRFFHTLWHQPHEVFSAL